MSELRQDPFTDRWVIIAPDRVQRPLEFSRTEARRDEMTCPFCLGNETETPQPVATYRSLPGDDQSAWQCRVVPNLYPAVRLSADAHAAGASGGLHAGGEDGLGQCLPGFGVQEVIIESPEHLVSFSELNESQVELVFRAYRERLLALASNPRLADALVFKNSGMEAGATLQHTHSQLIALPWIAPELQYELTKAQEYRQLRGETLMQSVLDAEIADGCRILMCTDRFAVFCPAASRLPYETWIVPRQPAPRYELEPPDVAAEAARLARDVILRLEKTLDRPAYNYWIHSAPFRDDSTRIHWRIAIAPRLSRMAGFEMGTGCFINSVTPEEAAVRLR